MLQSLIMAPNYAPYTIAAKEALKTANAAYRNPEKAASFLDFLLALVLYALIAAAVGAIGAAVAKFVFDAKKEDVQNTFFGIGVVVLVVCIICYFMF